VSGPGHLLFSVLVGAASLGKMDPPMAVLIYVDTNKQVGDPDHLKVFASSGVVC